MSRSRTMLTLTLVAALLYLSERLVPCMDSCRDVCNDSCESVDVEEHDSHERPCEAESHDAPCNQDEGAAGHCDHCACACHVPALTPASVETPPLTLSIGPHLLPSPGPLAREASPPDHIPLT